MGFFVCFLSVCLFYFRFLLNSSSFGSTVLTKKKKQTSCCPPDFWTHVYHVTMYGFTKMRSCACQKEMHKNVNGTVLGVLGCFMWFFTDFHVFHFPEVSNLRVFLSHSEKYILKNQVVALCLRLNHVELYGKGRRSLHWRKWNVSGGDKRQAVLSLTLNHSSMEFSEKRLLKGHWMEMGDIFCHTPGVHQAVCFRGERWEPGTR